MATDRGRIERHIKPALGAKFVRDITTNDIEKAMHAIRLGKTATDVKTAPRGRAIVTGGAGVAGQAVILLGSIFSRHSPCDLHNRSIVKKHTVF